MHANPYGHLVNKKHSDGRYMYECWEQLFLANEVNHKERKHDLVLTDSELAAAMRRLFPDRLRIISVSKARSMFNSKYGDSIWSFQYKKRRNGISVRQPLSKKGWIRGRPRR